MKKEQKVFGADTKASEKNEDKKAEGIQEMSGEESGQQLISKLMQDSKKRSDSRKKKKIEEYKVHRATRESLFKRLGQTIDIPIIMNDDEVEVFTIKRLSEAENSEIIDRVLAIKDPTEMTEEELEESNAYNYRLLEKVVIDPYLTQEEWRLKVPTAIVQTLMSKIMQVLTNIDDSKVFEDFQK